MFCPHVGLLELLVVVTVNGAQPVMLSTSNAATGIGFTQIVFIIESLPQKLFAATFNFILYTPGVVKFSCRELDPAVHKDGSSNPKLLPKVPLISDQPVAGLIVHIGFPGIHVPLSIEFPLFPLLVRVTILFTQTVSFGEIEKDAVGFLDT